MRTNTRRWRSIAALLLVAGLALPAPTAADEREKRGKEEGGGGGGVCSPRPAGCKQEDCRCEDKKTCTKCRQFVCRRDKKHPPVVVCRPCCKDSKGHEKCSPAPDDDDRKCVPSPS